MSPCPSDEGSGLGCIQRRPRSPDGGHLSAGFPDDPKHDKEGRELPSALFRREERTGTGGNAHKGAFYRATDARLGPKWTPGNTNPNTAWDAGCARPGEGNLSHRGQSSPGSPVAHPWLTHGPAASLASSSTFTFKLANTCPKGE